MAWHADASTLYARCSNMAVVGLMPGGDETVAFTFGRAAGAEKRSETCMAGASSCGNCPVLPAKMHACTNPIQAAPCPCACSCAEPSFVCALCSPGLKSEFYAPRDLSIACYLLLSALAYSSRSVPLALLVLCLNFANLSVCMRLKGEKGRSARPPGGHALPAIACTPRRHALPS